MKVRRVGVAGLGIGRTHIAAGWAPHPGFAVHAVCDPDPARRAAVAAEFAVPVQVADFADLLADPDIEIIDICTPPALHHRQAMAALAAGRHVLCEKPLAGTLSECDELIAAERAGPGILMPIFQYRFGAGIAAARRVLAAGIAGRPHLASAETFWRRGPDYYANPWRGRRTSELGGALISHAMHLHDLLTLLMGPVAAVQGRVATRVNPIEVEDCATASVEFASGALGAIACTLGAQEESSRLCLHFAHVSFESSRAPYAPGAGPWRILTSSDAVQRRIDDLLGEASPVREGYAGQMAALHAHLEGDAPLAVTAADARAALELATAICESSACGTRVTLPMVLGSPRESGPRPRP